MAYRKKIISAGPAVRRATLENFLGVGACLNRAGDALASARLRRLGADVGLTSGFASNASLFALFLRGFYVVMPLAKTLQVALVSEHIPVAAVWDDVVNDRRRCAVPRIAWRI